MKDSAWLLDKLQHPASLEVADQAELREIIAEYPYFALPYLLLARQMHQHSHPAYDQLLPVISLRAQDRKKLFRLVHELEAKPAHEMNPQQESPDPPIESDPVEETHSNLDRAEIVEDSEVNEAEIEQQESDMMEIPEEDVPLETGSEIPMAENEPEEEPVEEAEKRSRFVLESGEITHDAEDRTATDETEEERSQQELAEIPFGKARTQQSEAESVEEIETEEESDVEESTTDAAELQESEAQESIEASNNYPVSEADQSEQAAMAGSSTEDESLREQPDDSQIGNFFSWLDKFDHLKEEHVSEIREVRSESGDEEVPELRQESELDEQLSIIDEFIEKQPSISRIQGEFFDPASYAKESERMQDDMITETIARIFVQQEKYQKALDAYKKLQLKYPKKKAYFAALISEINEKIK